MSCLSGTKAAIQARAVAVRDTVKANSKKSIGLAIVIAAITGGVLALHYTVGLPKAALSTKDFFASHTWAQLAGIGAGGLVVGTGVGAGIMRAVKRKEALPETVTDDTRVDAKADTAQ